MKQSGMATDRVVEKIFSHTQAKSFDTLMKRVKEAIELCLDAEEESSVEFVGVQRVAIGA